MPLDPPAELSQRTDGEMEAPEPRAGQSARRLLPFWLLAGLFLGSNLGGAVDQARSLGIDPVLLGAWRDCGWRVRLSGQVMQQVEAANRGLLIGDVLGLITGAITWRLISYVALPEPVVQPWCEHLRPRAAPTIPAPPPLGNGPRNSIGLWLWPARDTGHCPHCKHDGCKRIHRTRIDRLRFWKQVKRFHCPNCQREFVFAAS